MARNSLDRAGIGEIAVDQLGLGHWEPSAASSAGVDGAPEINADERRGGSRYGEREMTRRPN